MCGEQAGNLHRSCTAATCPDTSADLLSRLWLLHDSVCHAESYMCLCSWLSQQALLCGLVALIQIWGSKTCCLPHGQSGSVHMHLVWDVTSRPVLH